MWILDPKTKEPSVTITMMVPGFLVCILKLLISGLTIGGLTMGHFSGSDFATAIGALGMIYAARKHTDSKVDPKE